MRYYGKRDAEEAMDRYRLSDFSSFKILLSLHITFCRKIVVYFRRFLLSDKNLASKQAWTVQVVVTLNSNNDVFTMMFY